MTEDWRKPGQGLAMTLQNQGGLAKLGDLYKCPFFSVVKNVHVT